MGAACEVNEGKKTDYFIMRNGSVLSGNSSGEVSTIRDALIVESSYAENPEFFLSSLTVSRYSTDAAGI